MSRAKSGSAFSRGYAFRRFNLSAGYMIFYALMLTAVTVGITQVLASTRLSFGVVAPEFLYSTPLGLIYVYNIVCFAVFAIGTVAFPSYVRLDELQNNRWYMLSKMGIPVSTLVTSRIAVAFVGVLRIYLLGFALTLGISLVISGFALTGVGYLALSFAAGVLCAVLVISPLFLLSSLVGGRLVLSLCAVVLAALAGLLMHLCGYFSPDSYEAVAAATARLVSLSPTGLLLCSVILGAACLFGAVSVCTKKCGAYNIEELDADALISLDVRPELLILEKGQKGYSVAISGPEVNNADIDLPLPQISEESWLDTHSGPTPEEVAELLDKPSDPSDMISPDVLDI